METITPAVFRDEYGGTYNYLAYAENLGGTGFIARSSLMRGNPKSLPADVARELDVVALTPGKRFKVLATVCPVNGETATRWYREIMHGDRVVGRHLEREVYQ